MLVVIASKQLKKDKGREDKATLINRELFCERVTHGFFIFMNERELYKDPR